MHLALHSVAVKKKHYKKEVIQITKKKTKRQIKLVQLHQKLFSGMSDYEIENIAPKILVTLFRRVSDGNIGAHIKDCPVCGKNHTHHWNIKTNEYRAAHCEKVNDLTYPMQYELILDWTYANNARFQAEFLQQVKDFEKDPEAFRKAATKKQRIYHEKLEAKREEKLMYGHW